MARTIKTWRRLSCFDSSEEEALLTYDEGDDDGKPDWKLQVFVRQAPNELAAVETYLVHQKIVAYGERRSEYLVHLLRESLKDQMPRRKKLRKDDHQQSNVIRSRPWRRDHPIPLSSIDLTEEHAKMVPSLLDFMYFYSKDLDDGDDDDDDNGDESNYGILSDDSRRLNPSLKSLYELATMWKVPEFQVALAEFQSKLFTVETALDALKFASNLSSSSLLKRELNYCCNKTSHDHDHHDGDRDDPLLTSTIKWFASHIVEIKPSQVASVPPTTLLEILHENLSMGFGYRIDDFARSKVVVCCIHHHLQQVVVHPKNRLSSLLSKEVFYALTDEDFVPFINPKFEAPVLLLAESEIRPDDISSDNCNPMTRGLSNLEKRCIRSIVTYWHTVWKGFASSSTSLSILSVSSTSITYTTTINTTDKSESSSITGDDSNSSHNDQSRHSNTTKGEEALLEFLHELPLGVLVELLGQTAAKYGGLAKLSKFPRPWTRSRLPSMILQLVQEAIQSSPHGDETETTVDDDAISDDDEQTNTAYDEDSYSNILCSSDSSNDDEGSGDEREEEEEWANVDQTELAYYICDLYECGQHNERIEI